MSYDIWLTIDTGGREPATVSEVGNHTYNCSLMFSTAIGCSLGELDGRTAGDVLEQLATGVTHMLCHPEVYQPMNPANGWGSYDSALAYLQELAKQCAAHPRAQIRVC